MRAEELIRILGLKPHPEGGWYRETYRAKGRIPARALPRRYRGARRYATAILFLLREGERSLLHRVASDELWHFHLGGPLTLTEIPPSGIPRRIVLGPDVRRGQRLQHAVAAGRWFGAAPSPGSGFCLVGCTVAPGFDFADFELGKRDALLRRFPRAAAAIRRLT
ncbi:MAG: cupin domain-containing protein [Elusimicrobia bacterium]|nr:cupin domain-containing protein [Elusimicrobiota bacterium]